MALFLIFVGTLLTISYALSKAYDEGPVKASNRANLWYSTKNESVDLAVAVNLNPTRDALWLGLGLAVPGSLGMRGADLFSVEFLKNGEKCVNGTDRHAPFVRFPRSGRNASVFAPVDNATEGTWTVIECRRFVNGTISLEVTRLINPDDFVEDGPIKPGTTRVLHAYGAGNFAYHGALNRESSPVVLLSTGNNTDTPPAPTETPVPSDASGSFKFTSGTFNVTGNNLTCYTTIMNVPDAAMVVAITPLVKSKSVVRMLIFGCEDTPYFKDFNKVRDRCDNPDYSSGSERDARCTTVFYSWAPGIGRLVFPPEAGLKLSNLNRRLVMELTFDNLKGPYKRGDAGVELHYAKKARPHEVGTLALGAPTNPWVGILIQNATSECPTECTEYWKNPINLFAVHMHLGKYGYSVELERVRKKEMVDRDVIASVPIWAPHLEQIHRFDKPFQINPKDQLFLLCNTAPDRRRNIVYSRSADQEQCEAYAHYWPAQVRTNEEDGSLFYCSNEANVHGELKTLCGAGFRNLLINSDPCFPVHAQVQLSDGRSVSMTNLQVGDDVLVAPGVYSPVFMFSHQHRDVSHSFAVLKFEGQRDDFIVTEGHMLYVNGVLTKAGVIRPGDFVEDADGLPLRVRYVTREVHRGLFNPQTVHGDIIVNGVRATTFTESVEPSIAHALLAPFRSTYHVIGGDAITSFVCGSGRLALLRLRNLLSWTR